MPLHLLWAHESHRVAVNWAYAIETVADPDEEQNVDLLVEKMMNFLLNGLSPVAQAPEVPAEYSEKL